MQILYLTRFSFFGQSGWRSPAAADPALLFEPARLKARLRLFERYTLASLAAQTDRDFHHVILSSSLMPEPWRSLLVQVSRRALGDRARVIFRPKRSAGHVLRRYVRAHYGNLDHVVQVVLDDDDALSADFTRALRYHAGCVINDPLNEDPATFLSFPRGFSLGVDDAGLPRWMSPRNVPWTNLGLALVSRPDWRKNPFMTAHRRIGERQAGRLIGADRPFYLRAVHAHNDSRAIASDEHLSPEQIRASYRHFPFLEPLFAPRLAPAEAPAGTPAIAPARRAA